MANRSRSLRTSVCFVVLLLNLVACSKRTAPSPVAGAAEASSRAPVHEPERRPSEFRATATLRELMDAQIDPAADFVWESVASISTQAGIEERQPRTEEEWREVRRNALRLIEATNLLVIPGRKVSAEYQPAGGNGELDSREIQAKIEANWPAFVAFAHLLHDASSSALRAIDAKDANTLLDVGGTIDQACEACHTTFWYPNVFK